MSEQPLEFPVQRGRRPPTMSWYPRPGWPAPPPGPPAVDVASIESAVAAALAPAVPPTLPGLEERPVTELPVVDPIPSDLPASAVPPGTRAVATPAAEPDSIGAVTAPVVLLEQVVAPAVLAPADTADDPEAPVRPGGERLLFAAVMFGGLLVPLNSSMIAVALPDIRTEFEVSRGAIAWLLSCYLITVTVAQPIAGSLGDQLGRARVLRLGLLVFMVSSLVATVAPTFELLVAARIGQAASGAALIPNGMAMLRAMVPTHRLGRAMGQLDSAFGTAAAIGPVIGALLIEGGTWRLLFLVNAPMVAIAFWLLLRLDYRDPQPAQRPRIDWIGAALLTGILSGATWLFGAFDGDASGAMIAVVSVAVVTLVVGFIGRQVVSRVGMAPWGLFRRPSFAAAIAYALLTNVVLYAALLTIPFFVREVQAGSAARIGLLLGAMSVLFVFGPLLGGRLSDRVGRRVPAVLGALLILSGTLMLAFGLAADVSFAYLAVALALVGSGVGLGSSPATTAAVEIAPRSLAGTVNGTDQMVTYIGGIVGAGVLTAVLGGSATAADVDLFRTVFVVASVIAVLTVLAAAVIHGRLTEEARPA